MDKIQHKTISTNGVNLHVAEIGDGPAVLLLHGFPELWYTWRHQMLYLSSHGYRAVAPDLRGYGDSDAPEGGASSYTVFHVVGDLVGILDALGLDTVFLVGHDWGAIIAWAFCILRPDRIKALVNMSVVFQPRNPLCRPVEAMRAVLGEDFYVCRIQAPGEFEEVLAGVGDTATVIKSVLTSRDPNPPMIPKRSEPRNIIPAENIPATIDMPSWLTEEDVQYYATKFAKKGFTGGLNYYRALDLNWELTAPWTGVQIKVPVKFIVGDLDQTYNSPGVKEYINDNGGFRQHVPLLHEVVVMEGVAHFCNQEKADEVSQHVYDFIRKF